MGWGAIEQASAVQQGGSVHIDARHADGALAMLAAVLGHTGPHREVQRRGGSMREVAGLCTIAISNPREHLVLNPARHLDPWVALAEFPWLMAGRSDISWMARYLPRAKEFADDGLYWRAGYGPRLRRWRQFAQPEVDQLAGVVELLRRDPATRQAVVTLWDPAADLGVSTKDMPCTNWMHFQTVFEGPSREPKLDLLVGMRSNDLMWGFSGVNVVNFCLLQELVASLCGLELGTYRHVASNMHIYERHFERMPYIADGPEVYGRLRDGGFINHLGPWSNDLGVFTQRCRKALELLEEARDRATPALLLPHEWGDRIGNQWLGDWAYFMSLHTWAKRKDGAQGAAWWLDALRFVRHPAWKVAAAQWLDRRQLAESHVLGEVLAEVTIGEEGERAPLLRGGRYA